LIDSYDDTQDETFSYDKEEVFIKSLDEPIIETTKLVLKKNVKLKIIGSETANEYTFSGAGSVVDVDNRDVPKMLEKGLGNQSCCGSFSTSYFEIVR
jgi:hypothetical protein